ncbi:ATP-binding cassette domain-containing protein [Suttonella sp. R2A3]|uniref:ATP-binding cassette domain-containing protein n=1 Tax=Suttonella sp. R2A3 TaxID=2908648 RepID=UPI001F3BCBD5|nr:ATP-binding cassette domain-containing protein [Suttonella sp. R2A3]UJF25263.1 ATP-binding cassette domain-containing protein [Suttonella sp. R2A3]
MIELNNIRLSRGSDRLLSGANARIHDGQRVGLVGQNGSGKSSLLALLRGELEQDEGDLSLPQGWQIASVRQETPALDQSALDYVLSGHHSYIAAQKALSQAEASGEGMAIAHAHEMLSTIDAYAQPARAATLLSGLGFHPDTHHHAVKSFSGGWRMRLNLAQALIAPAELLLLDEPTNHLDLDAIIWLQDFLKTHHATQIIIAHDRDFLDSLCQQILFIEHGSLYHYRGNYSEFERQHHERRTQAEALYRAESAKRAHLQSFVDRFRAKATKAKQAQSRLKALEKLSAAPPPPTPSSYDIVFPAPERQPNPLLQLENASVGYDDDTLIIEHINLSIEHDARIGLLGRNGAGKSTLMKLLAGTLAPKQGARAAHRFTQIGYFTQHSLDALDPDGNPLSHLQRLWPESSEQALRNFLGGYGFQGDDVHAPIKRFSGGEKARLALALVIAHQPNLLLLDEPTNHLDIAMRDALTYGLQSFQGAMLIISHDRAMLRSTCDTFYWVRDRRLDPFDGSLDDYRDALLNEQKTETHQSETSSGSHTAAARQAQKRHEAEKRRALQPLNQQLKRTEDKLASVQQKLTALEQQLADSALYEAENKAQLNEVLAAQTAATREHSDLEATWLEVMEEIEAASARWEDHAD